MYKFYTYPQSCPQKEKTPEYEKNLDFYGSFLYSCFVLSDFITIHARIINDEADQKPYRIPG